MKGKMKGGGDDNSGAILGVVGFGAVLLMFFIIVFHMTGGLSNYRYMNRYSERDRRDIARIRRLRRMRNQLLEDDYY